MASAPFEVEGSPSAIPRLRTAIKNDSKIAKAFETEKVCFVLILVVVVLIFITVGTGESKGRV
jgi:hypothetical protein